MKYGDILILGIVFSPVYVMLIGWFLGRPRSLRLPLLGVGYLAVITVGMWGGLALFAMVLEFAFF